MFLGTSINRLALLLTLLFSITMLWYGLKSYGFQYGPKGENYFNRIFEYQNNSALQASQSNIRHSTDIQQDAIAERFEKRKIYIREPCKRISGKLVNPHKMEHPIVYLKKYNIIYCPIEKVASTFWQKVIYTIAHPDESVDAFDVNQEYAYKNTDRLLYYGNVSGIFKDSISFMFVRDPFTRLLSGYQNKFLTLCYVFWDTGRLIIKEERNNISEKTLNCGHDVSFKEFVSYYAKRILSGEQVNTHFTSSINHCDVCELDFKYIGKYETIKEDTKFILDKLPIPDKFDIDSTFEERSVISMIKEEVKETFDNKKKWMKCMSFPCGLFRLWRRYKCQGFISKNIPFPYPNRNEAEKATVDEFLAKVIEARERSDPNEISNNRNEVLIEAYQSLGKDTFHTFLKAFDNDFDIFGYSRRMDIFNFDDMTNSPHSKRKNEFSYFEKCPF